MSIGERLREERERLKLSQPAFAAVAGTTKQTLFSWESGKTSPDGFQLSALAEAGVDVLYVLTGEYTGGAKPAAGLTPEEDTLLSYFREASKEVRRAALGALIGATSPSTASVRDIHLTNTSAGGIQVGLQTGGKVVVKRKGK